jgi:hypothetical protein
LFQSPWFFLSTLNTATHRHVVGTIYPKPTKEQAGIGKAVRENQYRSPRKQKFPAAQGLQPFISAADAGC